MNTTQKRFLFIGFIVVIAVIAVAALQNSPWLSTRALPGTSSTPVAMTEEVNEVCGCVCLQGSALICPEPGVDGRCTDPYYEFSKVRDAAECAVKNSQRCRGYDPIAGNFPQYGELAECGLTAGPSQPLQNEDSASQPVSP